MSLHLLTAQTAQYFSLLFTIPWDLLFSPCQHEARAGGRTRWEADTARLAPGTGQYLVSMWSQRFDSCRGFMAAQTRKIPQSPPKKTPKRQIVLTAFLVPNVRNITALSYSYDFTLRYWKNPHILVETSWKVLLKVLSRLSGDTNHHLHHPIAFLILVFSPGCFWGLGAS